MAHPGVPTALRGTMVAALYAAGLEVLLDVVFTTPPRATPRADPVPPWPGQPSYYRLDPADPAAMWTHHRHTGNALNAGDPVCLQLIMDSLRYWVTRDGRGRYCFDLAPTLARQ
jgi:isoamylase